MKNIDKYNSTIINILFSVFPLSLILGNLVTNLNIFLLCFFALFFYNKNLVNFKTNLLDKIIIIFFFYTFVTLVVNYFDSYFNGYVFSKLVIVKTILYLKYLALYLILRVLISQNILKLDWFSLACALCAAFVCIDIFYQFVFGKDIFGYEPYFKSYSGVFGTELIAGGYLQKFGLFVIFLPFLTKQKFSHKFLIQLILFFIFLFGIILSGNRTPFVLYVFSFLIYLILDKKLRKKFFSVFIILLLTIVLVVNINKSFKKRMYGFYNNGTFAIQNLLTKDLLNEPEEVWLKPYISQVYCFTYSFKNNPIFGGGIRSYRTHVNCNTHPHNYYLEILSDLGLLGLIIILTFVFMLLNKILLKKITRFQFNLNIIDDKVMPFLLIFFIEFFPIRTTGSFFTTSNASTLFLVMAILVSLISEKKIYNN